MKNKEIENQFQSTNFIVESVVHQNEGNMFFKSQEMVQKVRIQANPNDLNLDHITTQTYADDDALSRTMPPTEPTTLNEATLCLCCSVQPGVKEATLCLCFNMQPTVSRSVSLACGAAQYYQIVRDLRRDQEAVHCDGGIARGAEPWSFHRAVRSPTLSQWFIGCRQAFTAR